MKKYYNNERMSSAAVVIGTLRVKNFSVLKIGHSHRTQLAKYLERGKIESQQQHTCLALNAGIESNVL